MYNRVIIVMLLLRCTLGQKIEYSQLRQPQNTNSFPVRLDTQLLEILQSKPIGCYAMLSSL